MRYWVRLIMIITILLSGVYVSCSKGEVMENVTWKDVLLYINLKDESGNELFDPDDKTHFIGDEIIGLEYQGKLYTLESEPDEDDKLLHLYTSKYLSKHCLTFGPLDGSLDIDVTMLVRFTRGAKWEIRYLCYDHDETTLLCQREWFYNGEKASNPLYLVRKTTSSSVED